ncbi:SlyX protein [Luteibacter sp. OK325]|nr:SlyX protein [Luteibacter sp. OK325]
MPITASVVAAAWRVATMTDTDERMMELEMRLAFIDDTVNGLSSADTEISRRLDRLERALRDLRSDLMNMRAGLGSDTANEPPPPHY